MPQAIKSTTIIEPTMAGVNHISFGGDLTDPAKTVVSVSLTLKDDAGEEVQDLGVIVEGITNLSGLLTSFASGVLPKIIDKVEADLGITFV